MAVLRDALCDEITLQHGSNSCEPIFTEDSGYPTRCQLFKNKLYKELLEKKLREKQVVTSREKICLKKVDIPKDAEELKRLSQEFPLYGSSALSFWQVHSHPKRQFRNTYNFTKPMSKYFDGPWRNQ